jgi:hypothetical protein
MAHTEAEYQAYVSDRGGIKGRVKQAAKETIIDRLIELANEIDAARDADNLDPNEMAAKLCGFVIASRDMLGEVDQI